MPATQWFFQRTVDAIFTTFGVCYDRHFKRFHSRYFQNPDRRSSSRCHCCVLCHCFGRISLHGNLILGFERRVFLTGGHDVPEPPRDRLTRTSARSAVRTVKSPRTRAQQIVGCREHMHFKRSSHVEEMDLADVRVVPRFCRNFTSPSAGFA